ncbi:MAG: hypothetical protein K0Q47_110 [Sedimentibacter sp.]|jgi:hypothetical protein|nr:hypothetical protein [Sedimentibacter sp.]
MAEKLIKKVKKTIAKPSQEKGLIDVSVIPGLKAIEISTRKFTQYDLDFTYPGCKIEFPVIRDYDLIDAIVKVNIKIKSDDIHKINIKEFEEMLKEKAYVVKPIVPQILKTRRVRIKKLTADLPPIKAVEVWLIEKGHKDADQILSIADDIIRKIGTV